MTTIRSFNVKENNPKDFLERLQIAGALALQADITAIYAEIWKYDSYDDMVNDRNGIQVLTELSFVVANTIFNTLQTDGQWERLDMIGYNFKATVPAAYSSLGTNKAVGRYRTVQFRIDRSAAGQDDFYNDPYYCHVQPVAVS